MTTSADDHGVREDVVEQLLGAFRQGGGGAGLGAFMGIEFQHDPPTDAERAEAERRYTDELTQRIEDGDAPEVDGLDKA